VGLYFDRGREFYLHRLVELVLTVLGARRSEHEADNFSVCCARRAVPHLLVYPDGLTGFNDLGGLRTVYGMYCMYVRTYVRTYVFMYVCMYLRYVCDVCMYACNICIKYVCMYVDMHTRNICMYICMYAYLSVYYVCMYVCMYEVYVCMCLCAYNIDITALSIFRRLTNLKFGPFLYEILNSENYCIFCVTNVSAHRNDSSVLFKGNFSVSQKNQKEFYTYVAKYKDCV
jgi:hypothetical protein